MSSLFQNSEHSGPAELTVALVGPDQERLRGVADALAACQRGADHKGKLRLVFEAGLVVQEFSAYPTDLNNLPKALVQDFDVVIIDLDSDPEFALKLVKGISTKGTATVMIYSSTADVDLVVRSMRAGAREFLNLPVTPENIADALTRVTVQRPASRPAKRPLTRKLLVFLGSKGGCGVTALSSNFAVALAQESGQSTLLIDLGVPIGDVAINLGIIPKYSTANALHDYSRLDGSFLASLLTKHSSGLHVLAAPDAFANTPPSNAAIDKMLSVARQNFEYVVVDAGSRVDLKGTAVFDSNAIVYLVTQVGISELRNANRMITQLFAPRINSVQVVLNRYTPRTLGFDEEHITKALTMTAQWRIPDDYAAARRTQNSAIPLALEDSAISRAIRQMARTACGLSEVIEKKKRFGIFG
jgi:pilus assembly protein CpaE